MTLEKISNYKVALVQMQSQACIKDNFQQAKGFLHEAATQHNAKLIVFPENFLCMGAPDYSLVSDDILHYVKQFSDLAKHYSVSLLLGSVPVKSSEGKCFSRSILIDSLGSHSGAYDKMHLFDVEVGDRQGAYKESDTFLPGQRHQLAAIEQSKLGFTICYDLRFPELFQVLRKEGADMIAVPSAFTYKTGQAHWDVLLRARAIETQCFILAANQCGTHLIKNTGIERETWGHSMIVDPWGKVLCSLEHSPGVCSAVLDFSYMDNIRQSMSVFKHKRL